MLTQRYSAAAVLAVALSAALLAIDLPHIALPILLSLAVAAYLLTPFSAADKRGRQAVLISIAVVGVVIHGVQIKQRVDHPDRWNIAVLALDGETRAIAGQPLAPGQIANDVNAVKAVNAHTATQGQSAENHHAFIPNVLDAALTNLSISTLAMLPLNVLVAGISSTVWQCVFVAMAAVLLVRLMVQGLPSGRDLPSQTAFAVALLTLNPASLLTGFHQASMYACLAILIVIAGRGTAASKGALAALGLAIKPIMLVAAVYFVLSRQIKATRLFLIALLVLAVPAAAVIGMPPIASEIGAQIIDRVALFEYTQADTQNLHSFMLEPFQATTSDHAAIRMSVYFLITLLIAATLTAAAIAQRSGLHHLVLPTCICAMLLVYPGTLTSFGVLLLLPISVIVVRSKQQLITATSAKNELHQKWIRHLPLWVGAAVGVITTLHFVSAFFAIAATWFGLLALCLLDKTPDHAQSQYVSQSLSAQCRNQFIRTGITRKARNHTGRTS